MAQFSGLPKRRVAQILLGNAVRKFLNMGGRLQYDPRMEAKTKRTLWYVIGVTADGKTELPVYTVAGQPKCFRTADAMIRYHCEMCPDDRELTIRLPKMA